MEPYYQKDGITIYHGDCREVLPQLGTFDLLLTDPPYGINAANMNLGAHNPLPKLNWDKAAPDMDTLDACISAATAAVVWGGNYFPLPPSRCFLVWDKTPEMQGRSFAEAEIAWCSWDAVARVFRFSPTQMSKKHPTQKPLCLMRWCISLISDGYMQSVIDPFMGSGTTLVAAKLEGKQAVGIELEERYCEIAANRLAQGVLPFGT